MRFNISGTTALYLAQAIVDWVNNMDETMDNYDVRFFASDIWEDSEKLIELKNKIIEELKTKSFNDFIEWSWYVTNREKENQ